MATHTTHQLLHAARMTAEALTDMVDLILQTEEEIDRTLLTTARDGAKILHRLLNEQEMMMLFKIIKEDNLEKGETQ